MKTPFSFMHLDHIVLRTAKPDRLVDFYQLLGCSIVRDTRDTSGLVQLRLGNSMLDIVDINGEIGRAGDTGKGPAKDGRNVDHFAVRIEPFDEPKIVAFCAEHGIPAKAMRSNLLGADGLGPAVYIEDPEGNRVELKGPPQDD